LIITTAGKPVILQVLGLTFIKSFPRMKIVANGWQFYGTQDVLNKTSK